MSELQEHFSEKNEKNLEPETQLEILPEGEPGEKMETAGENLEEKEQEIGELRREIENAGNEAEQPQAENQEREERIRQYQERYLPDYLQGKPGFISRLITNIWRRGAKNTEIENRENIPEQGACLVICNHFGGGDTDAISEAFKEKNLHFAVAKRVWWDTNPFVRWFLKRLGTIPVEESLANLTEEEKEGAIKSQFGRARRVFREIAEREKQGKLATNIEFARQAVAVLLKGEALGIFPEGLWCHPESAFRRGQEMEQGYAGIELVARQYEKIAGEKLPIVPTAFIEDRGSGEKKLIIGEQLFFEDNHTSLSNTDWAMAHVASMLPPEQRGYYQDKVEEIT